MPAIDQIVKVDISQLAQAVTQAAFSVPLIVGPSAPSGWGSDVVRTYSSADALLEDGFTTSSPEYIYAQKLMSQSITPAQFLVGLRGEGEGGAEAQIDDFSLVGSPVEGDQYGLTIDGTPFVVTATVGQTQQQILTAIGTASDIGNALVTFQVTGTGVNAKIRFTGTIGNPVTYSAITQLERTSVAEVGGEPASITDALAAITAVNDTWYGLIVAGASDADITEAAAYIESVRKLFVAVTDTADVAGSGTSDLGSTLKAASYKRTALMYSPAGKAAGIDAAWVGGQLPQTPGSNNWAFKNLSGITADKLTETEQANLIGSPVAGIAGKNVNIYQAVGGLNLTQMGTTASGQFIDLTIGVDWLESRIQESVFSTLANANKIPMTDAGVGMLMQAVRQPIDIGVINGLVDGTANITVVAEPIASIPQNQRAKRIAPTIRFECRLTGALNAVSVSGTVNI